MGYSFFGWAAKRYDLHTPPDHYQHDHRFVLEELAELPPGAQILDAGCGTGVFLEKARTMGLEVFGIDASEAMAAIAAGRIGRERVEVKTMQAIEERAAFDGIVSLCWSFNYCASLADASAVLHRFFRALRPNGKLILQVAHAPHASGLLHEDRETGPTGQRNDVLFLYRFSREEANEPILRAEYVYACHSLSELLCETHRLHAADVLQLAALARETGFEISAVYDTWRRDPLACSCSPFLIARRR